MKSIQPLWFNRRLLVTMSVSADRHPSIVRHVFEFYPRGFRRTCHEFNKVPEVLLRWIAMTMQWERRGRIVRNAPDWINCRYALPRRPSLGYFVRAHVCMRFLPPYDRDTATDAQCLSATLSRLLEPLLEL